MTGECAGVRAGAGEGLLLGLLVLGPARLGRVPLVQAQPVFGDHKQLGTQALISTLMSRHPIFSSRDRRSGCNGDSSVGPTILLKNKVDLGKHVASLQISDFFYLI